MRVTLTDIAHREAVVRLHRSGDHTVGKIHRHSHIELEANLVLRGWAEVILDDRRYRLGPDILVWLFPDQEHLLIDQSDDFAMWVIVFTPTLVRTTVQGTESVLTNSNPYGFFHRRIETRTRHLLDGLCQDLADLELPDHHRTLGVRWLLLTAWRAFQRAVVVLEQDRLDPAVAATVRLLEQGRDAEDLVSLAASVGVSAPWLSRRFKAQLGMNLGEYRNRQRMRRFFEVVESDPSHHLTAAAYAAGFASYAQFHRLFTRYMRRGPRAWRKEIGEK